MNMNGIGKNVDTEFLTVFKSFENNYLKNNSRKTQVMSTTFYENQKIMYRTASYTMK